MTDRSFLGYNLETKCFEIYIHTRFASLDDVKAYTEWLLKKSKSSE